MLSWQSGIQVLDEKAYLAYIQVLREKEELLSHIAQLHSTNSGCIQAIIKYFPENGKNKGLINEVTGYITAKAANLPVADEAYLIRLSAKKLQSIHPESQLAIPNSGEVVAWATKIVQGPPFRLLYNLQDEKVISRLRKWQYLPEMLAFDDWVGNTDRSGDNLVVSHNGRFTLIDHADIAGGICWLADFLDPYAIYEADLIKDLNFSTDMPSRIESGMIIAAEKHRDIFDLARDDLNKWLKLLSPDSQADAMALHEYLEKRACNSIERIRQQTGLLV